jgi:hypothetical protein
VGASDTQTPPKDRPGVNRHILHGEIAARTLKFFGDNLRAR